MHRLHRKVILLIMLFMNIGTLAFGQPWDKSREFVEIIKTSVEMTMLFDNPDNTIDRKYAYVVKIIELDTNLSYCSYSIVCVENKNDIESLRPYCSMEYGEALIIFNTNKISESILNGVNCIPNNNLTDRYFPNMKRTSGNNILLFSPHIGLFEYFNKKMQSGKGKIHYSFKFPLSAVENKYWPIDHYQYSSTIQVDSTNHFKRIPFAYLYEYGYSEKEIKNLIEGEVKLKEKKSP